VRRASETGGVRIALALVVAVLAASVPASAVPPPPRVAFTYGLTTSHPDVVTLAADGSDLRNLTPGDPAFYTADMNPSWSPDGTKIAFDSHRDSNVSTEIYVMNADGSDQRRLTHDSGQNGIFSSQPLWSPLGDWIAFQRIVNGQAADLWVIRPDGTDRRQLTGDNGSKRSVSWSPDGSRLLYVRVDMSGNRVYTVGLDGELPSPLTPVAPSEPSPVWSPDGSQIAYSAPALTVMNADGSNPRRITDIGVSGPDWSPDGTRIAFTGLRQFPKYASPRFGTPGRQDVFVVDADGDNLHRLTGPFADEELYGPVGGSQPTWWPDSSRLFYVSQRYPEPPTTFVMDADGTCEGRFGPQGSDVQRPVWQPSGGSLPPPTRCAELRLSAEITKTTVALNEQASWTFTVDNDGNEPATHVRFDVGIGTSYVTVLSSPTPGCRTTGISVTCLVDRVAPGASASATILGSRTEAGPIRLEDQVFSDQLDTDPTNNSTFAGADVLPCTTVGTWGNDFLYGTPRADKICGLPGADTIYGGKGNDFIDAGNGNDRIYPGPGRDTVIAKGGDDVIEARDGRRDWIDCGSQHDIAIVDRVDVTRRCEVVARPPT
jgi:Tol biopolymer transport system component